MHLEGKGNVNDIFFQKLCLGILSHFPTGSFTGAINSSANYLALNKQYFATGIIFTKKETIKTNGGLNMLFRLALHLLQTLMFLTILYICHVRGIQLQNIAQNLPIYTLSSCILTCRR